MKLNLNSKEILALHNLLYGRFESCHYAHPAPVEPASSTDETQLRQVYNRLRALLIGALSNKVVDPLDAWLGHEQAKLDDLRSDLDQVKQDQSDLVRTRPIVPEDFMDGNDDYEKRLNEYPRRAHGSGSTKPTKHHRKR